MKGIPLIETNDPKLVARGYNLALKLVANVPAVITLEQLEHYERDLPALQEVVRRGFILPGEQKMEVVETPRPQPPILTSTGQTFVDWLEAREKIHEFLTGERIKLREMFEINDLTLVRTDIMPVFRPAGATNRLALDWKVKLGMKASYEETGVMKYRNSVGPKVPQLGFIRRSVRPDENTLGKFAKSPDDLQLVKVEQNQAWLNLYGWSDADNLHSLITGNHLDSVDTLTWFPDDRLPGDKKVAGGTWSSVRARARFGWSLRSYCNPFIGGRLAEFFPSKS